MGDEQGGLLFVEQHPCHVLLQDHLGLGIEGRERLVEEQHLWVDGQGASQGGALAHAAGELERVVIGVTVEVAAVEQVQGHLLPGGGGHALDLQAQLHVAADAAPRHQQILLQHERDLRHGPGDRLATDEHFTFAGPVQARAHIQNGALATTGWADDRHHFTPANLEVHLANGEGRVRFTLGRETFTDIAKFNFCRLQLFLESGVIPLGRHGVHLFHSHQVGSLVCFIGDTPFSA